MFAYYRVIIVTLYLVVLNDLSLNYVIDFDISGTDLSSCAKLLFVTILLDVVGKGVVVGREELLSPPDEVAVTSSTAAILLLKRAEDGRRSRILRAQK